MDTQETRVFFIVLIVVVIIGIIIYYFFSCLQKNHRQILRLKMKNITAELNSIEQDRARIASDLHDELSPMLSAIKLKISSFELADPEDRVQQQKTDTHLSDVLQKIRTISYNLMPITLKRNGLKAALTEFTSYMSKKDDFFIELRAEDIFLDEAQNIHVYRIVQEIVHNTVKHAGATLLHIVLRKEGGLIVLSSKDNGRGFDHQQKLSEGNGFGLRNLRNRTDVLGGQLYIESAPGKGTAYTIEIPANELL